MVVKKTTKFVYIEDFLQKNYIQNISYNQFSNHKCQNNVVITANDDKLTDEDNGMSAVTNQ